MFKARHIYFCICFLIGSLLFGQKTKTVNELKTQIATSKNDTSRVLGLIDLANVLVNSQFKDAIVYANEALDISFKVNYTRGKSLAYNSLADAYWFHSDYDKAQQNYFKAYRISDSIHDQKAIAFSLYNIGWILCIQQHSYKDDTYLYQSLEIYRSLHDTDGLLKIYNALASYYVDRSHEKKEARQYFDSAILYFNNGIELAKKSKLFDHLGRIYGNLGDLFYVQKDFKTAKFYNEKSIEIHRKMEDSSSLIIGLLNLGLCEMQTNDVKSAIAKFNLAYDYNQQHDIKDVQTIVLRALAESHYKLGKFKDGYDYYEQYVALQQQLDKEAYSTNISNLQGSYSLEKSEANVDQLRQANEIQELKNKKNIYFILGLIVVALIVIIVAALLFKQNKQKQLTNVQLKEQNHIIAEKKQEIDNSIQYAKGIQQAILPHIDELVNQFPQSFVYYKPKDVVSGDFYWFGKVDDDFYCIAADCTGHGVPGALMSIIGIDKIVQAIFEKKIEKPGSILSFLNQQIKQVLKQHSDASKQMDGMDIALLKFNSALSQVEFSGANRPLLFIRDKKLIEYKANKLAIAGFTSPDQEFTTTAVPLQKNDSLYIFTDGYADQFGGDEGKKFMSKNLKELLISISDLPSQEQEQQIGKAFMDWKRSYEQVDDVLIIGLKI
ncbi:MAG: SpoIIE family protein phosphatase [Bacteroidota bacterium]